jgi:hypothetical protein
MIFTSFLATLLNARQKKDGEKGEGERKEKGEREKKQKGEREREKDGDRKFVCVSERKKKEKRD